jgi:hypothetical protein
VEAQQPHPIATKRCFGAPQSVIQCGGHRCRRPGVRRCRLMRQPRAKIVPRPVPQRRAGVGDQVEVDQQPGPQVAFAQQPIGSQADVRRLGRCQQAA